MSKRKFAAALLLVLMALLGTGCGPLMEMVRDLQGQVLTYDDRYTFEKEIEDIRTLEVTSRQTGMEEADKAVLVTDPENPARVRAAGCGRAEVLFADGTSQKVKVEPAPISLFLIAGQSNAEGCICDSRDIGRSRNQWVINPEGTVYSTYGVSAPMNNIDMYSSVAWYEDQDQVGAFSLRNFARFVPQSLTDNNLNDAYNRTNTLTDAADAVGKGGIDSALAYKWHALTGEKVWIVNAARHGSSIRQWDPRERGAAGFFRPAVKLYKEAEKILDDEIEAGHYRLAHKGIYWLQGETDGYLKLSAAQYMKHFERMYRSFVYELDGKMTLHMNRKMDFFGLIIPRASIFYPNESQDYALCGARMAQYYLPLSGEWPDIYMASSLSDTWTGNESVKSYFLNKYGDADSFNAAFPTGSRLDLPAKLTDVHKTIHYTQIGYNEIGADAAYNICCALDLCRKESQRVTSVTFLTQDGKKARNGETVQVPAEKRQPLAVRVEPAYLTKTVKVELSDNLDYAFTGLRIKEGTGGEVRVRRGSLKETIYFTK